MTARLIWKKSCDNCRRYKKALDALGVDYESREMNSAPISAAEFDQLIGERPIKPFLNTRNAVYRAQKLGQNIPISVSSISFPESLK